MRESWRWFGESDSVPLDSIRQAGATDVVSALHNIAIGEPWPVEQVELHKTAIESCPENTTPLKWTVVESIPVHESIKRGEPDRDGYIDAWIESLRNVAKCGIKVICYNFMPVLDWIRTDLGYKMPTGALALRFDQPKFAAFDLFILQREGAEADYSQAEIANARAVFEQMTADERQKLADVIAIGLPGKMTEQLSVEELKKALRLYKGIGRAELRSNLSYFLDRVLPVAEELGVKLAIHPDDPPRDVLGLPRIICTAQDLRWLFERHASSANGMTLCVGTYGSRPDNDLPVMAREFAERIYFAHLRGTSRDDQEQRSFVEADHLGSDVDMVAVIRELLVAEHRRKNFAAEQQWEIFVRPDHGHQMLNDLDDERAFPGYTAIGRLKGLAEIRGVIRALSWNHSEQDKGDDPLFLREI